MPLAEVVRERCLRLPGGDMSDREPELRAGPPWVMEEMIQAELGLPAQISAEPAVSHVAEHVGEAVSAGEAILICGCGPASTPLALSRRS